jgi:phosphohistidine phosphatase
MELILWRHADAELGQPDGERRLTDKGLKQAARMAKWLAARLPEDYAVMASPAVRAQQTARALSEDLKTVPDLDTSASARDLIRACGWPRGGTVVAVGHQPTMGEVASLLLTGTSSSWAVKKGAIVWLSLRGAEARPRLRAWISPDLL